MAAITIADPPNVIAQPNVQWRMSTTWTPALDVLQGVAQRLAKVVVTTIRAGMSRAPWPSSAEKTPMARKVHASFTKFQAGGALGPRGRGRLPSARGDVSWWWPTDVGSVLGLTIRPSLLLRADQVID
jgi:hypothetical protein